MEPSKIDNFEDFLLCLFYCDPLQHSGILTDILKSKNFDYTVNDDIALCIACQKGWTDIVKIILEDHRVCPFARNDFAIETAILHNHVGIIEMFTDFIYPQEYISSWKTPKNTRSIIHLNGEFVEKKHKTHACNIV